MMNCRHRRDDGHDASQRLLELRTMKAACSHATGLLLPFPSHPTPLRSNIHKARLQRQGGPWRLTEFNHLQGVNKTCCPAVKPRSVVIVVTATTACIQQLQLAGVSVASLLIRSVWFCHKVTHFYSTIVN